MKKTLLVLLDAMNMDYLERMPFLSSNLNIYRLQPMIGYGSTLATILTGRKPSIHGVWNSFYFDPSSKGRYLTKLFRLYGNANPALYKNLIKHGREVSPSLKKPHFSPNAFPVPTIFDTLRLQGRPFLYINLPWVASNSYFLPVPLQYNDDLALQITKLFNMSNYDLLFLHLYDSDRRGHKEAGSEKMNEFLKELDKKVERLVKQWPGEIIIFSDHGMHQVNNLIDVTTALDKSNYFIESTLLRLYKPTEETVDKISRFTGGRWLTKEEIQYYTKDQKYGTHFWSCQTGNVLFPNFWNKNPPLFMHGHHNEPPTLLATTFPLNNKAYTMKELHDIIKNQL